MPNTPISGKYFPYCQLCIHDGTCELRHCDYIGCPPGEGVDRTPYGGHEKLDWAMTAFQNGTSRGQCTGRIGATDSVFYPLQCECGTVVNSLSLSGRVCAKFAPNEKGQERMEAVRRIAAEKGIRPADLSSDDLPELDPAYHAVMTR